MTTPDPPEVAEPTPERIRWQELLDGYQEQAAQEQEGLQELTEDERTETD